MRQSRPEAVPLPGPEIDGIPSVMVYGVPKGTDPAELLAAITGKNVTRADGSIAGPRDLPPGVVRPIDKDAETGPDPRPKAT